MGYKRKAKVYKLVFTDPELDGLEVRARSITLADLLNVTRLQALQTMSEQDINDLLVYFAKALVSWNVELPAADDDTDGDGGKDAPPAVPVPATLDGMLELDWPLMNAIMMAWADAIAGVPAPLPSGSPSGGPSLEQSIPMEPLSASRAS